MAASRTLDPRIGLLAIGTFAVGTDAFVVAGILPLLAAAFAVSLPAAGLIVSTYSLSYGLGTPVLAALVARWPRPPVVLATLCAFAVVNIACAVAPSYGVLIALKAAAGLCAAVYTPTAYLLAASLVHSSRRGAALATVAIGLTMASVMGIPIGTWVGFRFGWHATFGLIAAITLTGAAAIWRGRLRDEAGIGAPLSLALRIAPLGRARVWLALLPCLLMYIGTALTFTYVAALLETHYRPDQLPALLAVYGLGGLIGSQLGGRLSDRLGPVRPLYLGLAGLIAVQLLVPFSLGSLPATCAVLFGTTLGTWGAFTPFQARIMQLEPDNAAVTIALINTGVYLGNAIGAVVGGLLLGIMPVTDLPFASALVVASAMIVLAVPLARERAT
jgi:predicted MFS family arabinose efflux permease